MSDDPSGRHVDEAKEASSTNTDADDETSFFTKVT